jgi:hypothetical protein
MVTTRALLAGIFVFTASVAFGQNKPVIPSQTALCELVSHPERYDRKIVSVRAPVRIEFEDFRLAASECVDRKIDDIWLYYGRGPKHQPTIWCCGDLTPRDSIRMVQNEDFRLFHRYLTDCRERTPSGRECFLYNLTATLTGRLDAQKTEIGRDGDSHVCPAGGWGHFGFYCARLVIQSVSNLDAKPRASANN